MRSRVARLRAMTAPALLSARGLHKQYPMGTEHVAALRGVDVDVLPGDFIALRGPSGSGKTTLINLLGLLDVPDQGQLLINGRDSATLSDNERTDLRRDRYGFVFQTFNLIPVLSAAENVGYPMLLKQEPPADLEARAHELLAAVGLTGKERARPDLLSGGQRQRVAIARALANQPTIIFADEPTASLDSHTADSILDLMGQLNKERGVAFVISTHDPRVVERAARVITLHDGKIAPEAA